MAHFFVLSPSDAFLLYAFWVLAAQVAGLVILKLDLIVWRYIGFDDLKRFALWAFYSAACMTLINLVFAQAPVYVPILNSGLLFLGFVGIRVLRRSVYEYESFLNEADKAKHEESKKTVLLGAGEVGVMAARAFRKSRDQKLQIVGFIDDDPRKKDALIQQLPVLGTVLQLPELVREYGIECVVISIAKISRQSIRRMVDICKSIPVEVRVVPGYSDIVQGHLAVNSIREINIEDLLGREPVQWDLEGLRENIRDQVILVTGAGGSIGSELCRQIARLSPKQLVLFDISETALFEISQELSGAPIVNRVGNCASWNKIDSIFNQYRPKIIFHAAAYKHVTLMEQNPFEAVDANVIGTYYTALAAQKYAAERFVLVSTDKAVEPSCVMGASKCIAEKIVSSLGFRIVRFGNVLGSSGSVIPIFKKQIALGGPVTVTDPEMRRYFMTIPEACQLILQAAFSPEDANLFILDMGEPIHIKSLAEDMIRLAGFEPGSDIEIKFSGKKPGEKLTEQLYLEHELLGRSQNQRLLLGQLPSAESWLTHWWQQLEIAHSTRNENHLRELMGVDFVKKCE